MYTLQVASRVLKRLKHLPPKHRRQVWTQIKSLEENPRPQDCKKLKGSLEGYRVTIGEYRLLYTIDDQEQEVRAYLLFHRGRVILAERLS